MKIQFCGADRTVTGSSHMIEVNGLRLFLDMGLYQGPRQQAREMNLWLPAGAKEADAVILTHGHLDHCGKLPVLTRAGFSGAIYTTAATAEVARIVLEDSAEIQEEDAQYLNRRAVQPGQEPIRPLYVRSDIAPLMRLFKRVNYGQRVDLGKGVSVTFHDAGHILGSAYVILRWTEGGRERSLLFTGDLGRFNTPIIRDPEALPGQVESFITESTYGTIKHGATDAIVPQLLDAVKYCIAHRSRLLVPAFAVGRTQVMLWHMQRFIQNGDIPAIPIYVDSPMGVDISRIHSQFPEYWDDQTRAAIGKNDLFGTSRVVFASSTQDSKKINGDAGPCVIIASSPTCEFGRICHHLAQSIERPNDTVIFVGWTPPNTLGRRLQDGQRRVRIYDRWYDVKCQVRTIHGLSAHADGDEIAQFLSPTLKPGTTGYVVHGEAEVADAFAMRLAVAGLDRVGVPAMQSGEISL